MMDFSYVYIQKKQSVGRKHVDMKPTYPMNMSGLVGVPRLPRVHK